MILISKTPPPPFYILFYYFLDMKRLQWHEAWMKLKACSYKPEKIDFDNRRRNPKQVPKIFSASHGSRTQMLHTRTVVCFQQGEVNGNIYGQMLPLATQWWAACEKERSPSKSYVKQQHSVGGVICMCWKHLHAFGVFWEWKLQLMLTTNKNRSNSHQKWTIPSSALSCRSK